MSIVIIGAGHAAAQCIMNLRREGVQDKIVLIGSEPALPYMRPPLSKAFLQGKQTAEQLLIKPEKFYQDNDVEFIHDTVASINVQENKISLDKSEPLFYEKLILATGANLRQLNIPGANLKGIHYLKTLADAESIKSAMQTAKKLVVCGGGYIGLEVAASARQLGLDVTVLEMGERIMQRAVSPIVSEYFANLHQQHGVKIVCNETVSSFAGELKIERVVCKNSIEFDADLVVVGIGVIPATSLAEEAGLAVNNGILVNEFCQTNVDNIYAVGDCSNHHNMIYDKALRLECIQNANGQAKVAASHIAKKSLPYNELPWFWSDQYEVKLQIAGLIEDYDDLVVREGPESGFSVIALKDNFVIAAEVINNAKDFIAAKSLITKRVRVSRQALSDTSSPLNSFLE